MENLQIITLTPALANDQKELNVYVEKATDYKGKLAKIDTVNEENYEDAKKFRAEITSAKTSIEATRKTLKRPLLDLGSAIDERARELSKPFEEMKDELQGKI